MTKDCLYCGLQFSDTTNFCPSCGRSIERDFSIRPDQESESARLRKELQEKDDLIRQLVQTRPMPGEASRG
jgi:predicted  nucleic acid-binding Zn-ribbon protein